MHICKGSKYRLKVRNRHQLILAKTAGCNRFVWNYFLAKQKALLDSDKRILSYVDMCLELTELKKEEALFLKEVPSQTLQQTLKHLDRALKDGLSKKKGFPRFKKKWQHDSFRFPQGIQVGEQTIFLPKIGWIAFFSKARIEGEIKNATVTRRGKHWELAIQTEQELPEPKHPSRSCVGIDLGVVCFATLSTGEYHNPLNSFSRLEKCLRLQQRALSRKKKFSSNWKKQKQKVAETHIRIANARRDYLHKLSTTISKNHAVVVMEDLQVSQMSAKGKRSLNKKILDQGWYEFRRMLEYKLLWRGGKVLLVDPKNTSRKCPECGHISAKNRVSQSEFLCEVCRYSENADYIAARNIIMAVGHTVAACGDTEPLAV